ncbi:hypothetical protein FSS13T_09000 [Flavobacterium saliperosum S13]|uniref:Uncharacterized protein n=1 Tax=Flavobacterium saliperosum S13 TaxID=1341155 RepID=A0ABN0QHP8_9FLAO|nr:hypothetical protein FSS13T_09000 [Flavobacterium saliperosum S13]
MLLYFSFCFELVSKYFLTDFIKKAPAVGRGFNCILKFDFQFKQ